MNKSKNEEENGSEVDSRSHQPKKKSLVKWLVVLVLSLPAGLLSGAAVLNYTGFCFDQSRYLSDEERIRRGVHGALGHYPSIRFVHDQLPKAGYPILTEKTDGSGTGTEKGTVLTAEQLIFYRDMDEFFAVNSDCCSVTRNGLYDEVGRPGLWDKITGFSAGYVNIKFRVRYRDAAGNVQSEFSAFSFNYTNCGHSVPVY